MTPCGTLNNKQIRMATAVTVHKVDILCNGTGFSYSYFISYLLLSYEIAILFNEVSP